jgi:hypothetical protein
LKKSSPERKRTSIIKIVRGLLENGIVDVIVIAAKVMSMRNQIMKDQNSKGAEVVLKA